MSIYASARPVLSIMKYISFLHSLGLRISRLIPDVVVFYWMLLSLLLYRDQRGHSPWFQLKVTQILEIWNS
jgi:hypothetical protein